MARSSEVVPPNPAVLRGIDRVLSVQRPVVLAHIRAIRRGRPTATPAEIIRSLERRYLAAVTTGGAAVGATAAVPAIGTGASLVLSGAETAGFLEASALFAQSVTEVHGIPTVDPDRARALVMTLVLGTAGTDLVRQFAGQATGTAPGRTAYWGQMLTQNLPITALNPMLDRVKRLFLKKFTLAQGTNIVGRLVPFGIGAVIGGGGNHVLGRQVVRTAREGFGPAPDVFPDWLEPRVKVTTPKAPKQPKPAREAGRRRELRIPLPSLPALARRRAKALEAPDEALEPARDDGPAPTA